jgi:pimeloyl-ACP methyl ester carboxylesterase
MRERDIKTDGLTQHVREAGEGPLVLFCHGFPELAWSWRKQLPDVAAAGFHAVAPDMRGYGGTDRPSAIEDYTIFHMVGDMVDLVRALDRDRAVIVGHDWGAPVAWHAALLRPDVFRAVAGLSVPFQGRNPAAPPVKMIRAIGEARGLGKFYFDYFQEPGVAEAEFADVEATLRKTVSGWDGATPRELRGSGWIKDAGMFAAMPTPERLPGWMTEADFAVFVEAFRRTGFTGPLNWYRNIDRNWALTAFAQGKTIDVPALFIVGENDPVRGFADVGEAELRTRVPKLTKAVLVPGAGHWVQQERPDVVNAELIGFLKGL